MVCAVCGKEVESLKDAAYEITGWERVREGGGTNHVLWRKRTDRVMCGGCVVDRLYGKPDPNQLTLA